MSSGIRPSYSAAFRNITSALPPGTMEKIERLGISPRARRLNELWSRYCGAQYDARAVDFDGEAHLDTLEREMVASTHSMPPGFVDAAGALSTKYRRPSSPYHLGRVVPDRFTGLLFSESRHPKIRCAGDPDTEDYVGALADSARLWAKMIQARKFGGSTGTAIASFKFVKGLPRVEVHDPRWCEPEFEDGEDLLLTRLEKRYIYPVEMKVEGEPGKWEAVPFWYRRVIDQESDVTYPPVPVGEGEEPDWDHLHPAFGKARRWDHGFGFCPARWVQNLPVEDDVDGEPDCAGAFDLMDRIDVLLSFADFGTASNCDPTPVISTDAKDWPVLKKGSNFAVKVEKGGDFRYAEITGNGPKAALDLADRFRSLALEVVQCVIEHPEQSMRTATEITRTYAAMTAKADILREQYGQQLVLPLLKMMVEAVQKLTQPKQGTAPNGQPAILRGTIKLPPRVENGVLVDRKLGPGAPLQLLWPPYFDPSLQDATAAVTAASQAKLAGLVDQEHASQMVAPYIGVEDVVGMLDNIKKEKAEDDKAMSAMLATGQRPFGGGKPPR